MQFILRLLYGRLSLLFAVLQPEDMPLLTVMLAIGVAAALLGWRNRYWTLANNGMRASICHSIFIDLSRLDSSQIKKQQSW
jgi:hypothetical protein